MCKGYSFEFPSEGILVFDNDQNTLATMNVYEFYISLGDTNKHKFR